MNDFDITMSLVVRHPDIDPAQITRELGFSPDHVWRKGEQRLDEEGIVLGGNHRASYWYCQIAGRPTFPEEEIAIGTELSHVLDTLRKSIAFMQDLQYGGGSTELRITIHARGDFRIELLPEQAALLGRLGVALTIEVKPYWTATQASVQ